MIVMKYIVQTHTYVIISYTNYDILISINFILLLFSPLNYNYIYIHIIINYLCYMLKTKKKINTVIK